MITIALTRTRWLQVHTEIIGSALRLWLSCEPVNVDIVWTRLADIGIGLDYTVEDKAMILETLRSDGIIDVVDGTISGGFLGMRTWFKKGDSV